MGLLEQKKEIENKLNFYLTDDDGKRWAAYINTTDGTIRVFSEKIFTKEESIAICEWYLKTVKEL